MVEPSSRAGSLPQLDAEGLQAAKENFLADIHAPSQRHVVKAKVQTIERALAMWQLSPFPPSVDKVPVSKREHVCQGARFGWGVSLEAPRHRCSHSGTWQRCKHLDRY